MKLQLFKFKCEKCRHQFKAPEIWLNSYGEFILRSSGDFGEVYLNAVSDDTYQEVNSLLKTNARIANKNPNVIASVLRKAYGMIACDPDDSGNCFQIGQFQKCPSCGCQRMEYWEATDPPEFVEKFIPYVTHDCWRSLSDTEKQQKVESALSILGY